MKTLKKYLKKSLSVICILLLVMNLIPINTANAETNSYLPKTSETEKVIVLDLSHDLKNKDAEAKEAYMAITSIQGIINRDHPIKIYLTHTPQEHDWTPFAADEAQLNSGLIPVEKVYPTLDYGKKYPVLSYLLKTYNKDISGMIQVPKLSGKIVDGAIMAGVTAAGVENSILVSENIEKYISKEGYSYDVKANTRHFQNNIDSFDWAYENYFDRCNKTFAAQHTFTAFGGGMDDQFPIMYDYFISSQVFVFCLNGNDATELAKLQSFLIPENYAAGTAILGLPVDEGKGIACMQDEGYYIAIMYVPNLTVTSSFEYNTEQIKLPPEPTALKTDNNTNYVAFFATDGDSMGFPTNFMYEQMTSSPRRGEVPIGWSFNPHLIDLYPTLLQSYSQNDYNSFYELVSSMNNGGSPKTAAGAQTYKERYINYMKRSNGLFQTINYFNDDEYVNDLTNAINPYLLIKGYQGQTNGNDVKWGNITDSNITFATMSGSTQGNAQSENIYQALKRISTTKSQETPTFTIVCVGDGRWSGDPALHVSEAIELLKKENPSQNYTFLRPADLAATYKAYQGDDTVAIGNPKHVSLENNQAIISITTDKDSVELVEGQTTPIKGYAMDSQGQYIPYQNISYESLNEDIATIEPNGKITAIKEGTTRLRIYKETVEKYIDVKIIGRKANSIAIDKTMFSTAVNGHVTIKAELYDQFGQLLPTPSFKWESLNETIAKVDNGTVIGIAPGQTELIVSYNNIEAKVQVTVLESTSSISRIVIDPSYLEMYENDIYPVTATAYDQDNHEVFGFQPKWNIENSSIARIDEDGYITTLSPGQTKIVATFGDNVSEKIDLEVKKDNRQKITFNDIAENDYVNSVNDVVNFEADSFKGYGKQGDIQGHAIKLDNERFEKAFTFNKKTILKSIKAYNPTENIITLTLNGGSNGSMSYQINPHKSLTLKTDFKTEIETYVIKTTNTDIAFGEFVYGQVDSIPTTLSIDQGTDQLSLSLDKHLNLTATLYDQNKNKMDYDSIEWSSDRSDIVAVDKFGQITGIAEGSTFIYAKTRGLVTSILVYVTASNIDRIDITPPSLTYYVGDIIPLTASAYDKDNQELHFPTTWVSENENIVSIDENHYAKARNVGTTQIKAIISGEEKTMLVYVKEHPDSDQIIDFNDFNEGEFVNTPIHDRVTFESDFWQVKDNVPEITGKAIHLKDEQTGEKAFFFDPQTTLKSFKVHNPTGSERMIAIKTLDNSLPKVEYMIPSGKTRTIYTNYTGQTTGYAIETYYQMLVGEIVYTDTLETGFSNEDIAQGIHTIEQPKFAQTQLRLPEIKGYEISIVESSHPDIIKTDGSIDALGIDQDVKITLQVSQNSLLKNTPAKTKQLNVKILGIPSDKILLKESITLASQKDLTLYTPSTVKPFTEALNNAKSAVENKALRQREVDAIELDLRTAITNLTKKANKEVLQQLLKDLSQINLSLYTPQSVTQFNVTLKKAESILKDEEIKQSHVDEIIKQLNDAHQKLAKRADKQKLQDLYNQLIIKDLSQYTPESIQLYQDILNKIELILNNHNINQKDVDEALSLLQSAETLLVKKVVITPDTDNPTEPKSPDSNKVVATHDYTPVYSFISLCTLSFITLLFIKRKKQH